MTEEAKDQVSDQDQSNASGEDAAKKDVVSFESHSKLLGQYKKNQEETKALAARLKELESKEASARESKMKEEGNFKALLEDREKKLQELQEQLSDYSGKVKDYEEAFDNTKKLNAFNRALGGKLKNDDYYRFVDTSKIAIDPETGKVDESSVKNYTKDFALKYKDLVDFGGAKLPDGAPRRDMSPGEPKTKSDLKEALKNALSKQ